MVNVLEIGVLYGLVNIFISRFSVLVELVQLRDHDNIKLKREPAKIFQGDKDGSVSRNLRREYMFS